MRNKILETSSDKFIQFGFKSITMDDIATTLTISKKTIYEHFDNKTDLVDACVDFVFDEIARKIQYIQNIETNPIEGLFQIKKIALKHMANSSQSPQFQLQKRELNVMGKGFRKSLKRGIKMGLFRPSINIELITRLYFNGIQGLRNPELFPSEEYKPNQLLENYLDYHVRAIATPKGTLLLEKYNTQKNQ